MSNVVKKYWVIGMGGFVEIRVSRKPLKAVTSKLTKTVVLPVNKYVDDGNGWGSYKIVDVEKKVTMKQTFYEGGKVLTTYTLPKWHKLANKLEIKGFKADSILEIPVETVRALRSQKNGSR